MLMLPKVKAVLVLGEDGARVSSKYYEQDTTVEMQKVFEDELFKKTKNVNTTKDADIVLFDDVIAVFRSSADVHLYVVGSQDENELILTTVLDALYAALTTVFKGPLSRKLLLDNLELLLKAVDELVDAGRIFETDPSAIVSRVLMKGADGRQPQGAELTVQQAFATAREEFVKRMGN